MNKYISMLRGINVSGQKKVNMEKLKGLYESFGFGNVRTYIQSGNVGFECHDAKAPELASGIERKIKQAFGFDVSVFIRTRNEFHKIIKNNPFAGKNESRIYVTFLQDRPANFPAEEIKKTKAKSEEFSVSRREIYLFCPDGYGRTKLSNNFFERKLKMPATTRNWNTVNALLSMADG